MLDLVGLKMTPYSKIMDEENKNKDLGKNLHQIFSLAARSKRKCPSRVGSDSKCIVNPLSIPYLY